MSYLSVSLRPFYLLLKNSFSNNNRLITQGLFHFPEINRLAHDEELSEAEQCAAYIISGNVAAHITLNTFAKGAKI